MVEANGASMKVCLIAKILSSAHDKNTPRSIGKSVVKKVVNLV
jgi:hypothetical protein